MRPRRTITNWIICLVAIALGFVAQGYLIRAEPVDGLILYAASIALFLVGIRGDGRDVTPSPTDQPVEETRIKATRWLISVLFFVVSILTLVIALQQTSLDGNIEQAWPFYLVSVAAFMVSMYLAESRAQPVPAAGPGLSWREGAVLLAIVGLAIFMRFYHFSSWPFGTWYDEADNALQVLNMFQDPAYRPIFVPSTNLPAHFLYLIFFSFKLFGPSTLSIRATTATLGVATVVAAYFFGREFFRNRMSLVLAFLVAVSRWDVNFSRIGLHGVSTPLFEFLTMFFVLRGLRTRSRVDFAWAGLCMGLGLSFYTSFRLFPIVVGIFLLHRMLTEKGFWHRHSLNLVVLALAAVIVFAPVISYAQKHPEDFWARTQRVSIFTSQPQDQLASALLKNTQAHALMFNYKGDPNGRHNLPGAPMLDFASSVFFILGLACCLLRLRQPRYSMLVVWLAVMLCGGIFSLPFEAPQSLRAIGALPATYILAVVALDLFREETWRSFNPSGKVLFRVLVCILLIWIGWDNYNTYFNVQARNFSSWTAYSTPETVMAREVNRLDPGYLMYFTPVLTNHLTTRFLAPGLTTQTPFDPVLHLPFQESGSTGVALFIDSESAGLVDLLRSYYPSLQKQDFGPPFEGPSVLTLITISREQIEALQGLPGRYYQREDDPASWTYQIDKTIDFDWSEKAPLDFPFQVEWRGVLMAPTYGVYGLRVTGQPPENVEVLLDEALVLGDRKATEQTIRLAKGRHDLQIHSRIPQPGTIAFQWQPPGGDWQTVPQQFLYMPPVTANGLAGHYYPNAEWQAPPAMVRVDPEISFYIHLIPMPRPYSVEWVGELDAPISGQYMFSIEVRDKAWLYIDDKLVLVNESPDEYRNATTTLSTGRHKIRVLFLDQTDHSHIYLYWTPPGQSPGIVPNNRLFLEPGGGWEPVSDTLSLNR